MTKQTLAVGQRQSTLSLLWLAGNRRGNPLQWDDKALLKQQKQKSSQQISKQKLMLSAELLVRSACLLMKPSICWIKSCCPFGSEAAQRCGADFVANTQSSSARACPEFTVAPGEVRNHPHGMVLVHLPIHTRTILKLNVDNNAHGWYDHVFALHSASSRLWFW